MFAFLAKLVAHLIVNVMANFIYDNFLKKPKAIKYQGVAYV